MFNCLLFGTKGCGKTQLLHMLAGTEPSPQAAPYTPNSGLRAARFIPGYDGAPDTVWLALLGIVHAYTHTHTHILSMSMQYSVAMLTNLKHNRNVDVLRS